MNYFVHNEMTGLLHPVSSEVFIAYYFWQKARETFEYFAKRGHNSHGLFSTHVYMDLTKAMDEAQKRLRPYANAWCIAKKGYSLN